MRIFTYLITVSILFGFVGLAPVQSVQAAEVGDLVTCPDYSSVYYLADDGTRWVFPNEATYFTWYDDFNDVVEISCEELSSYGIGSVVTYRPGTRLVKIQSIDKVYAVEPGGVLRWISSETMADGLFGGHWNERIDDVQDGFWSSYTEGNALAYGEYPAGTILKTTVTDHYIIRGDDTINYINPNYLPSVLDDYQVWTTEDYIETAHGNSVDSMLINEFRAQHKIDAFPLIEELEAYEDVQVLEGDSNCTNDFTCIILAGNNCDTKSIGYGFPSDGNPYMYTDSFYMSLDRNEVGECIFHFEYMDTTAEIMEEQYQAVLDVLDGDVDLLYQGVEVAAQGRKDLMNWVVIDYLIEDNHNGSLQAALTQWFNEDEVDLGVMATFAEYVEGDRKYDF
ncbi:MAG: hypothetical protein ABIH67_02130 [Candidatus Uhrbacteria bacterium]